MLLVSGWLPESVSYLIIKITVQCLPPEKKGSATPHWVIISHWRHIVESVFFTCTPWGEIPLKKCISFLLEERVSTKNRKLSTSYYFFESFRFLYFSITSDCLSLGCFSQMPQSIYNNRNSVLLGSKHQQVQRLVWPYCLHSHCVEGPEKSLGPLLEGTKPILDSSYLQSLTSQPHCTMDYEHSRFMARHKHLDHNKLPCHYIFIFNRTNYIKIWLSESPMTSSW